MINLKKQHYTKKYSARYFRNRLLQLQKLIAAKNIDCILLILGIDSNWDRQMQKCSNWLLEGLSGLDVNGTSLNSAFSNSILVITNDSLYIFTDSHGYKYISILAANVANCNMFCLSEVQEYTEDISQATKIAKFYQMMKDKSSVGLPLEGMKDDVKLVQKWPLIQAYGLDLIGGGFFTLKHQIYCINKELHEIYKSYDAFSFTKIVSDEIPQLNQHFYDSFYSFNKADPTKRQQFSQAQICEAFSMRYQFGEISIASQQQNLNKFEQGKENFSLIKDRQEDKLPVPRVLIGQRSEFGYQTRSSSSVKIKDSKSKSHFTLQYVERNSSMRVARTYFLDSLQKRRADVEILSKIYQIVSKAYKESGVDLVNNRVNIKDIIFKSFNHQSVKKCMSDAKFNIQHKLYNNFGNSVENCQNKPEDYLHILRIQISSIKDFQGNIIPGSILYCDTFIIIDPTTVFNLTETVPQILFFQSSRCSVDDSVNQLGKRFQTYEKIQAFLPLFHSENQQSKNNSKQERHQLSQMMIGNLTVFENGIVYSDTRLGDIKICFDELKQCRIYTDKDKENWLQFVLQSNEFLPLKGISKNSLLFHPSAEFLSQRFSWMIKTFEGDDDNVEQSTKKTVKVIRFDEFPYESSLHLCNFKHAKKIAINNFYDPIFNVVLEQQYAMLKSKQARSILTMMEYLMHAEMTVKFKDKSFLAYSVFEELLHQANQKPNTSLDSLSSASNQQQSGSPQSTSDTSSASSLLKKIYLISGIPGSGKTQLASSLVRYMNQKQETNNQNWVCVSTPFESRTKFSPKNLMASLEKAVEQSSKISDQNAAENYVIPITGYHHLKKVVYHFRAQNQFIANYKIQAVITKIQAKNFYMSKNKMIYQYLLQNCTAGLCNVIVLERAYMIENQFNEIIKILQSVNSVPIVKIKNKILNKLAFEQIRDSLKAVDRLERINKFHMKFNYSFEKQGKSKFHSDRFPVSCELVHYKAPFNGKLLKYHAASCMVRGGLEKIKNIETDVTNFSSITSVGVDQEAYLKDMIDSINEKFDSNSMLIQRFYGIGHFEGEEGKTAAISANGYQFSSKTEKSQCPVEEYKFLIFGRNLSKVRQFLNKFRTPPKERLPLKTRENISEEEIQQIETKNANHYIPEGIVYDGKLYYDFEGNIFERHPNLEDLIKMHIDQENSRIGDYNRALTKQEAANKKLYS